MDMKLEVVVIPVTDIDRAKRFYQKLGFRLDVDYAADESYRAIQMTPPGSESSIVFGKGVTSAKPGPINRMVLAVSDIDAARRELVAQGVEVGEVFHDAAGGLGAGFDARAGAHASGADPQRRSYASYACFSDPDGNVWMLQELKERLPGRATAKEPLKADVDILLAALNSAATAHGVHEKEIGKADPDWAPWYAQHMARTLGAKYQIAKP